MACTVVWLTKTGPFLETEAEFHRGTKMAENEKILFMLESMV